MKEEDQKKLIEILTNDNDITLYFVKQKGFETLIDSLSFNTLAIDILNVLLDHKEKLREEFQKVGGFMALIDFLYEKSKDPEKTEPLANEIIHSICEIIEAGSMNDFVRGELSSQKKIRDLFIIVITHMEIGTENLTILSSLVSFSGNLCYGQG
jgi:hypothetical protein